jgi:hypothetical protein
VVACVKAGEYRVDPRSDDWLGWKVAQILGLKVRPGKPGKAGSHDKVEKAKIQEAIQIWEESKVLVHAPGMSGQRKPVDVYRLGPGASGMLDFDAEE